jgi:putative DNA primase/helicase
LVKTLTGGDTITARRLYQNYFEFQPSHTLWLAANHKPRIVGMDDGIWRRVMLIPFTETIPAERRDAQLPAKLRRELSGILNWALAGAVAWREDGLRPPEAIIAATDVYRQSQDILAEFFEDCCHLGAIEEVEAGDLFGAYEHWAERQRIKHPLSRRGFYAALEERGFTRRKTHGRRLFVGLNIRAE